MKNMYALAISWTLKILLCLSSLISGCEPAKRLIIDTDMFRAIDDAGALLIACTHPGVHLLGVNINYPSTYSALAVSSMLGYYNHSNVPLGFPRPFSDDTFFDHFTFRQGEFASKVAYHWRSNASLPWDGVSAANTWDPVRLYRMLLSGQEDQSVTIASIGFLDNLSGLLSSPGDSYSPLSGKELVQAKVSELVMMGGRYPEGYEFNFYAYNSTAAAHVVSSWPGRITFSGGELGDTVFSGGKLMAQGPPGDPVKAAYQWFNGFDLMAKSWDPLTVLYAIEGLGNLFVLGNQGGRNHVFPNGSNVWRDEDSQGSSEHFYLRLAISDAEAGEIVDKLFLRGAAVAANGYWQ